MAGKSPGAPSFHIVVDYDSVLEDLGRSDPRHGVDAFDYDYGLPEDLCTVEDLATGVDEDSPEFQDAIDRMRKALDRIIKRERKERR